MGYIAFFLIFRLSGEEWRRAIILAATVWGMVITCIIEILSLPRALTRNNVAAAWLIIDVASLLYLWHVARRRHRGNVKMSQSVVGQITLTFSTADYGLLAGVVIVIALVGITALISPPNTWDAMTYHMPRVFYWLQNQSVAFYPTHELRQLHMPPGAEFAILHLHILHGGDGFDNLVQWFSLCGCIVGVSVLAQLLGANRSGQVFAAVVGVTIPAGILQASGAKNDYVVAFWLVALVFYILNFKHSTRIINLFGIGSTVALACLTKGTAYIFTLPIVIVLPLMWPWQHKIKFLKWLPMIILLVVGLNIGHALRNYELYGSFIGPTSESPSGEFKYSNDTMNISNFISNLIRNIALHMGTPNENFNKFLEKKIEKIIHIFNGEVNDPHTTWSFTTFYIPETSNREALAGNPIHLLLILLTLIVIVCGWKYMSNPSDVAICMTGLIMSFFGFCAVLKWQPWHTRLHLPLFVLWSPLISVTLTQVWPSFLTKSLGIVLLLLSSLPILGNELRPIIFSTQYTIFNQDRSALYFMDHLDVMQSYLDTINIVKRSECKNIGIDTISNEYEYPILALLGNKKDHRHIMNIGVENISSIYSKNEDDFNPCIVICLQCSKRKEKWNKYVLQLRSVSVFQDIVVFSSMR